MNNMKQLFLAILLFSSMAARSQCDTMTAATFSSITSNSCVISFNTSGTNWSTFYVALYDSITSVAAFTSTISTKSFTATGLSANRSYLLRVTTFCGAGYAEPLVFNKYVRTLQTPVGYTPMSGNGYKYNRIATDSTFHIPFQDTTLNRGVTRPGAIVCRPQDSLFYGWNGKKWALMGADVSSLVALINSKVDSVKYIGDTLYYYANGIAYGTVTNVADRVPYTGATQDVDLGNNNINAKSLFITGTGGNGHIDLKHQSANASATGQTTALFANSSGH